MAFPCRGMLAASLSWGLGASWGALEILITFGFWPHFCKTEADPGPPGMCLSSGLVFLPAWPQCLAGLCTMDTICSGFLSSLESSFLRHCSEGL
jgi:hypothetical protein